MFGDRRFCEKFGISNITNNSFEIYLQEPSNEDGNHALETLSYLVFEAGTYQLSDGTLVEVGTINTDSTANLENGGVTPWETVGFETNFAQTPAIFSQVQTITTVTSCEPVNKTPLRMGLK